MEVIHEISDSLNELVAAVPMAQEVSLLCFFILGFVLFRTEAMKTFLGRKPEKVAPGAVHTTYSVKQLKSMLAEGHYEQVIDTWPLLENFTSEALSAVVTALLVLERADDVGLFMAKAAVNLPHLRASFHETIEAMISPIGQVPQQRIAAALEDVFKQSSDALDSKATLTLLVGFARINDAQHVDEMLKHLSDKGEPASSDTLAAVVQGFLSCKNLDAALSHLQKVLELTGSSAPQELILAAARTAVECAAGEGSADGVSAVHDLLTILESFPCTPVEALTLIMMSAMRQSSCDSVLAQRAEARLRVVQAEEKLSMSTYETLIRANIHGNDCQKCIDLFNEMVEAYPETSEAVLLSLSSACVSPMNHTLAKHIYSWARQRKMGTSLLFSAVVKVLAISQQPQQICMLCEEALADKLELDSGLSGQLVRFASQAGRLDLAYKLLENCPMEGQDEASFLSLLHCCKQEGQVDMAVKLLRWAREVHKKSVIETTLGNALLDVCVAAGKQDAALEIFNQMRYGNSLDAGSYNILLKLYVGQKGLSEEAKSLMQEMANAGFGQTSSAYNAVLSGHVNQGDFAAVWRTVETMERSNINVDAQTLIIIFKGYKIQRNVMDGPNFDRALALLSRHSIKVDEVLIGAILEAGVSLRDFKRLNNVLNMFKRFGWDMPKRCTANTYSALIKAYGSTNQIGKAVQLWEQIRSDKALLPSEQMFAQMIDVLVTSGRLDDALQLFQEMRSMHAGRLHSQGFAVAFAMVIKGFAQQKECERALQCYEEMKELGVQVGIVVLNTLIDACCRVADMNGAAGLFRDMANFDVTADLITYSTMIKGFCVQGDLDRALELFGEMRRKGIKPDAIVFNSLLDGCARKEMPSLCEQVMNDMVQAGIPPSNYSASILIKLYGRIADLDAAFRVLDELPEKYGFCPNPAVYTTLMSSCTWNGRIDLAMELRLRMRKAGQQADEKTYSTLLRGAMRSGSQDYVATLLSEALEQGASCKRRLLDDEVVQSGLQLLMKRKAWTTHGGDTLLTKFWAAGYQVQAPSSGSHEAKGSYNRRRVLQK
eukprot:CAMPEP_0197660312 /NCGR_PEP_ID=MMETSP1338-20131121/50771_1 /TAXON_ID=43686 ORGANISM="Pelagodinium beii, Strain RCC1491" /NCGR_SAMPLE_ID=MMETSP1338 /ASSEMBLY_ACC=CAM_ASM_000754 /LENGTH=1055 /DNA_ID=CAMNT_0043237639 /DNA_START=152 /DNA_END=3319 /DNA_ORIENTATION=-